jgi:hypothetical protein
MANLGTLPLIVAELKNTPPQNGNSSFYEHHGRLILIAVIQTMCRRLPAAPVSIVAAASQSPNPKLRQT